MAKRHEHELGSGWAEAKSICIIHKLIWYKVQAAQLDYGYLADWSAQLGLIDRLNQALIEAGI